MEKVEISSVSLEELETKIKQWIREVLKEIGINQSISSKPMNAEETAAYLDMAVGTLYKKTACCEIPHIKRGKALLFHKAELDAWLESRKRQPLTPVIEENLQRSFIRQIRGKE